MQVNASILTIGDEILIGQIINTNSAFIAKQLNLIGISVTHMLTVGDKKQEILDTLFMCSKTSQVVLITGGLGPTSDDITKPALCEYFNTTMRFDEKVYEMVDVFVKQRGSSMNPLNKAQANVPVNAKIVYNYIGTAPGLWFEKDEVIYISMPGVPFEMEKMLLEQIIPGLKKQLSLGDIYHKTILTTGIPESKLAITIEEWEKQLPETIKLAYLPSPGMVKLRLSVYNQPQASEMVQKEIAKLEKILGDAIWGYDDDTIESVVGKLLKYQKKTMSTAESCTGGNIARLITSISGSSDYFKGSIVAYSNEVKIQQLGVPSEIIEKHGAVSGEVVEIMARASQKLFNTDCAIAVSGVAGPTGGTVEKPVGTVWVAVALNDQLVKEKLLFGDVRERNITRASAAALNLMRKMLI